MLFRSHSETVCTTDSCEDVAASKVEGQCLNSEKKNVGNLGSEHCAQSQMGQQSLSGIKPAVDLHAHTHIHTVLTAFFLVGSPVLPLYFSFSFTYILLPLWTLCWLKHACMHAYACCGCSQVGSFFQPVILLSAGINSLPRFSLAIITSVMIPVLVTPFFVRQ